MLYIILSIICVVLLVTILRLFDNFGIKTNYGIVWNYLVCLLCGIFLLDNKIIQIHNFINWQYAFLPVLLGSGFYIVFSLVGKSTTLVGVATTGMAFKLSFVIPVFFAFVLYHDSLSLFKVVGILLAVVAIFLVSYEKKTIKNTNPQNYFWYPILIFIGGGLLDTGFNYIQKKLLIDGWEHIINTAIFSGAFLISFALNCYHKELFQIKNIIGGIILGIPNYASLYFLMQALNQSSLEPSKIFPINNLGIICLSTFIGFVFFKETINIQKVIGILLAIISIIFIGFLH